MPNAKVLEAKQAAVAAIAAKIADSVAGVVVDYSGTSVADDTVLRKELREAGTTVTIQPMKKNMKQQISLLEKEGYTQFEKVYRR